MWWPKSSLKPSLTVVCGSAPWTINVLVQNWNVLRVLVISTLFRSQDIFFRIWTNIKFLFYRSEPSKSGSKLDWPGCTYSMKKILKVYSNNQTYAHGWLASIWLLIVFAQGVKVNIWIRKTNIAGCCEEGNCKQLMILVYFQSMNMMVVLKKLSILITNIYCSAFMEKAPNCGPRRYLFLILEKTKMESKEIASV